MITLFLFFCSLYSLTFTMNTQLIIQNNHQEENNKILNNTTNQSILYYASIIPPLHIDLTEKKRATRQRPANIYYNNSLQEINPRFITSVKHFDPLCHRIKITESPLCHGVKFTENLTAPKLIEYRPIIPFSNIVCPSIVGGSETPIPTGIYDGPNIYQNQLFTFTDLLKKFFSFKLIQLKMDQLSENQKMFESDPLEGQVTAVTLDKNHNKGVIFFRNTNNFFKTLLIYSSDDTYTMQTNEWNMEAPIKKALYMTENIVIALSINGDIYKLNLHNQQIEKIDLSNYFKHTFSIIDIAKNETFPNLWALIDTHKRLYLFNPEQPTHSAFYKIPSKVDAEKIWFNKTHILTEKKSNTTLKNSNLLLQYVLYELHTNVLNSSLDNNNAK